MMEFPHLLRHAAFVSAVLSLAGCSSTLGDGSLDPSAYAATGCNELNAEVKTVSAEISRVAIARGKVANTNVPNWVLGGRRVATAVVDRQTARIDRLQQQEQAIVAARNRNCGR
jgi:outer membrane murein-binding lipoprotein Lpp